MEFIPRVLSPERQTRPSDFTRQRKLPLHRLIVFVLHLVAKGRAEGMDIEAIRFFGQARQGGLWPEAEPASRSAIGRRRAKVAWEVFRDLLQKANSLAEELWPAAADALWRGLRVLAADGSRFALPASDALRREFDPQSGLEHAGKGHYPQCLVMTLYDVMRRLPLARSILPLASSERDMARQLLAQAPARSIVLFDRGFPQFELLDYLLHEFHGHFLMRGCGSNTFREIERFLQSGKSEDLILLRPSRSLLKSLPAAQRRTIRSKTLRLRAIRLVSPQGELSVLLTDLLDAQAYPAQELIELYFRRWRIEEYFREEKIVMDVEAFHGKTPNAIRQELFAAAVMTVIARLMAALAEQEHGLAPRQAQAKNALLATAEAACLLAAEPPRTAIELFRHLLERIARVKYYPPKNKRPAQPRVTKKPPNKWQLIKKTADKNP